ncbi:SDR family NAD(P)-dependent oxidoreductase [Cohnella sp. GbtcB17]|uniref:SDR family NAD(P)-dependent oxidoreductase n=1 Tax=Cohnella sp. GbtcB17 TaxID=2824762 RepID=UPI001C303565|nr:SDR family NAD(P)-dependent oxidoreductase [Cohnella sp. GbtcB17]
MTTVFTPQAPLSTGYGPRTTAAEVLAHTDLTGKIAIVTGGHSGLGLETSRQLAEAGAKVILPARSLQKAAEAAASIPGAEAAELDLADPASIDAFARQFLDSARPLHMLVHSAGIMAIPLERDKLGHELQFSTNFLGPFRLTARLWPALKAAGEARVVIVSSRGHRLGDIRWDDIDYRKGEYEKWAAYGQSKTAASLFAVELDLRGRGRGIRAFAVHPGSIVTNLSQYLTDDEMRGMGALDERGRRTFTAYNDERKTVPEGAATIVWCAASEMLRGKGGVYCENVDIAKLVVAGESNTNDAPRFGVEAYAVDQEAAKRLWSVAESMTGLAFTAD